LRRGVEEENNDEARPWFPAPTVRRRQTGELGSAARGTAHHRFLQHLALERSESLGEIEDEAGRLTRVAAEMRSIDQMLAAITGEEGPAEPGVAEQEARERRNVEHDSPIAPGQPLISSIALPLR